MDNYVDRQYLKIYHGGSDPKLSLPQPALADINAAKACVGGAVSGGMVAALATPVSIPAGAVGGCLSGAAGSYTVDALGGNDSGCDIM